jgi:thymidine kinase
VEYEALCRRHYMRRMTSPASPEVPRFELDLCPIPAPTLNL